MNVFLGCTADKLHVDECEANELYLASDLFRGRRAFLMDLIRQNVYEDEKIHYFILSAKYGLLEWKEKVSPYNLTLNDFSANEKREWTERVYNKLKEKNIDFNEFTYFLCGDNYSKYLKKYFPNSITEADLAKQEYSRCGLGFILKFYHDRYQLDIDMYKRELKEKYKQEAE